MDPNSPSIVHVTQPVEGGVCRAVRALVADQLERGWDVAVACPDGELAEAAAALGAVRLEWEARRAPGNATLLETIRLRRLLSAREPALVHLHSSKAGLAGRLALRGRLPTIFQPHGWSFYALSGPLRRAAVAWERLGARWADAVLCVSETERIRGEAAGIRAPWHVVPNGIDPREQNPATTVGRTRARERLGFGPGPLAVCIGRICHAKGQDVLLEAWPQVVERVPGARLALVGGGPDFAALSRRPAESVVFTGERDDVADWLAAADVVVAPSRWEGMSFAMLETMASARSLVITDVPGARDALGADASAVVPLGDLRALAAAVAERLTDPALAAGEGAALRARVERDFDIRDTMPRVAELYARLLDARLGDVEDPELAGAR